jgi:hypothetical protein
LRPWLSLGRPPSCVTLASCLSTLLRHQELGVTNEWVSETIFGTLFISFLLWTFSPFVTARKRFYTAVLYSRLLMVLVGASPPFFSSCAFQG